MPSRSQGAALRGLAAHDRMYRRCVTSYGSPASPTSSPSLARSLSCALPSANNTTVSAVGRAGAWTTFGPDGRCSARRSTHGGPTGAGASGRKTKAAGRGGARGRLLADGGNRAGVGLPPGECSSLRFHRIRLSATSEARLLGKSSTLALSPLEGRRLKTLERLHKLCSSSVVPHPSCAVFMNCGVATSLLETL